MKAKEMFEKLGFNQVEKNKEEIIYYHKMGDMVVNFALKHKKYQTFEDGQYAFTFVILDLHNAIHQQMKELGWLGESN